MTKNRVYWYITNLQPKAYEIVNGMCFGHKCGYIQQIKDNG